MDSVKPLALLVVGAVAEGTFWDGFGGALAQANIPHTEGQWGAVLATAAGILLSQAWQWWANRRNVNVLVDKRIAAHLAAYQLPADSEAVEPASDVPAASS